MTISRQFYVYIAIAFLLVIGFAIGLDWDGSVYSSGPATLLDWTERFNQTKNLVAIIGRSDSASTLSAAASYNRAGIPQLVTIATNPAITNIGVWTYRLCLSNTAQGPALAEYVVKDWKKRRIAIVFVNDDYGRRLAQLFEKRVRELGAEIVGSVMHRDVLDLDDCRADTLRAKPVAGRGQQAAGGRFAGHSES